MEFRDVSVSYRKHAEAVAQCNLVIEEGEFVFLVGKTGAGKSTLLKLISREVAPNAGRVVVAGKEINKQLPLTIPRLRRKMGIVPQDFALLPKKTVAENIAYASRAAGKTKRQTRRRMAFILFGIHLDHKMNSFPDELSGGERQRVAIGRALINDPPLLLADEPTGNLDPEHSMEVMQLLMNLNERGTTVVVASHDMMVVEKLGKRIIRLDQGRIVSDTKFPEMGQGEPPTEEIEEPVEEVAAEEASEPPIVEEPVTEEEIGAVEEPGDPEEESSADV
ncbi:MAG: ATP-binding cassette domain-containing protein [Armatimonadetes bacterium]|nr:ATP-binding cassette domain-containing protein [Armatimonadota bacterium]